jgi:hypothetical protein
VSCPVVSSYVAGTGHGGDAIDDARTHNAFDDASTHNAYDDADHAGADDARPEPHRAAVGPSGRPG